MSLFGLKIIESPLAQMPEPNRVHKRRRGMSERYHRRIQKKWNKRFGVRMVPCAIFMSPGAVGLDFLGGDKLVIHPERIGLIRNLASRDDIRSE